MSALTIVFLVYVLGFAIFMVAIFNEAPKHGSTVGAAHFVVALLWPIWGMWYISALLVDKWRAWRNK